MSRLTPNQERVLSFLREFTTTNGFPPTFNEISKALGFKSPSAAHDHLKRLDRDGHIKLVGKVSRGIQVFGIPGACEAQSEEAEPDTSMLTPRQKQVFQMIREFAVKNGYPPTYKEIAETMGMKSSSGAHQFVTKLERFGLVELVSGVSRGIKIKGLGRLDAIIRPAPQAASASTPNSHGQVHTAYQLLSPKNRHLLADIECPVTRFLFEQHTFVLNQIQAEIEQVDGFDAATYKTQLLFHAFAASQLTKTPMVFGPKICPTTSGAKAFVSQAELMEFVEYSMKLYKGETQEYLRYMGRRRELK